MIKNNLTKAVDLLRSGGLVAIPTETVYGLGADARNPDALRKIFAAKGRPIDHPLIVHLADLDQLSQWAVDVSDQALLLAKTFWPGPLTLILKKAPDVLDLVTGNQETIGIRIPNHPVAHALLQAFGGGVAAPSANRFGRISPTSAQAVHEELGDKVDWILDGGSCAIGVESTIVDVSGDTPVILRPGMIFANEIEAVLPEVVVNKKKNSPRVSGSHESHYAPRTKTCLVNTANLAEFLHKNSKWPIALMTHNKNHLSQENIHHVMMPDDAQQYAHDLYQTLRELDKKNFHMIVIEEVPDQAAWDAIRDRLMRATS